MFKIVTDYNALKANESRWDLLKDAVSAIVERAMGDDRCIPLLISGNVTYQILLFMETATLIVIALGTFYTEDNEKTDDTRFTKKDILQVLYEEGEFLQFLIKQLTLELQGSWKDTIQAIVQTEVEDDILEAEEVGEDDD